MEAGQDFTHWPNAGVPGTRTYRYEPGRHEVHSKADPAPPHPAHALSHLTHKSPKLLTYPIGHPITQVDPINKSGLTHDKH